MVGWLATVGIMIATHFIFLKENTAFRMFALIIVLLQSMKMMVTLNDHKHEFNWQKWFVFSVLSVEMNPSYIFDKQAGPIPNWKSHIIIGLRHLLIGIGIMIGAYFLRKMDNIHFLFIYVLGLFLLVGLSQILHFGVLRINTGIAHFLGYPASVLFQAPMKSKSLREFWGKRWNIAFTQMTSIIVYKPLSTKVGRQLSVIIAFLFSGILHEIAISFSVMECIGFPMIYFGIHALGMSIESTFFRKKPLGTWWVLAWLVFPLPILFHKPFMEQIVWPFILL